MAEDGALEQSGRARILGRFPESDKFRFERPPYRMLMNHKIKKGGDGTGRLTTLLRLGIFCLFTSSIWAATYPAPIENDRILRNFREFDASGGLTTFRIPLPLRR